MEDGAGQPIHCTATMSGFRIIGRQPSLAFARALPGGGQARNSLTNFMIPGAYKFCLELRTYLTFFFILNIPMVAGLSCLSAAMLPLPNVDNTQLGLNFELDLY